MPYVTEVAIGTLVRSHMLLLGKKDPTVSWDQYGSPLRYVLYGGKIRVDENESPLDAFVREFQEESGLTADKRFVEKVAEIHITKRLPCNRERYLHMHVFFAHAATGFLHRTEEMEEWRWCWCRASALPKPASVMPVADPYWLPSVFAGKKVIVHAVVDKFQRHLLEPIRIEEVNSFQEAEALCPSFV